VDDEWGRDNEVDEEQGSLIKNKMKLNKKKIQTGYQNFLKIGDLITKWVEITVLSF
jgi:hypothetical protein